MRLSCPACGAEMTLDVLVGHEGARGALLTALQLPAPLGKHVIAYLTLFRPPKRQLSWDRVDAILGELLPWIQAAQIERNGRQWPAPLDYWKAAFDEMLTKRDRLTLPLKSHGYLLEIIAGMGNKAEQAAESARERARAYPYSTERSHSGPVAVGDTVKGVAPMPAETRESIDKLLGRSRG